MEKYLYQDLYDLEDKHWWHASKRHICKIFLKKYLTVKNPKLLDIGCGAGKNLESLTKFGTAFGIDISPEAIQFCKKRGLKNVKVASIEHTKFSSRSLNLVCLLDVLEHVGEKSSLKEIHRILKNNGLLLITVPAYLWLWSTWDTVLHHKRRYTIHSLTNILSINKFEIVKISYMYPHLVLPVYLVRLIKSQKQNKEYTSDFKINNFILNKLFFLIAFIQNIFIINFSLPFGTSIVCIARKYEKSKEI